MPLVLRPPGESQPLTDRLTGLGRARRFAVVAEGVFRLAAVAAAAVGLACALDAAFHLPAAARAAGLVTTLVAVGVLYLRGIRRPAREPVHPLSVALLLEDAFPRFNDSLASAVQFLTADAATAERIGSPRFRRVAVIRAQNLAERYDIDRIVPSGRAWRAFWLMVLVGTVVAAAATVGGSRSALALVRFADPYGRHPWPTRTTIELLTPAAFPVRHAKGETFDLKFAVRGVILDRAAVHVRLADGPDAEDAVALTAADPAAKEAAGELRLDPGRVPRDFELRVTANDADTGWLAVTVAPPPVLVPLDGRPSPQVRLDYPAYTDLPSVELPNGTGVVEAVAGTRVSVRAAADRSIVNAVVRPQFDLAPAHLATVIAGLSNPHPLSVLAARTLVAEASADVPVRVSGTDSNRLEVEFTPRLPGLYALRFTDATGLTGVRLLDLRVFPDPPPVVALARPDPARDPVTLLPTANVPLQVRAEDRTFAVKDVTLEYRAGGPDGPFRSVPLVDAEAVARTAPAAVGTIPGPFRFKPTGVDAIRSVPLASLVKPDGSAPADGDVIALRVAATDWDDVARTKGPGRSREVEIRVVSKTGLEALLQTELAKLRPDLLRAREDQRATREAVAEVAKAAEAGKATPEDAVKLGKAEQAQRELRNKVADPADGLRAKADRLRQALRANGLPRSATTDRVEAVAADLTRLADERLEAADPAVSAARQEADKAAPGNAEKPDPKKLAEAADRAVREQQAAETLFDAVLERLEQWGGAGEVRGQARAIKDQLNKAGVDAAKAADRVPTGKDPEDLSPKERQDLEGPAGKLDELAKQADDLLGKAGRLAAEKDRQAAALAATAADKEKQATALAESAAAQKPGSEEAAALKAGAEKLKAEAAGLRKAADAAKAEADALRKSLQEAGGDGLKTDLQAAADALRQNQPGVASDRRQDAAGRLDRVTEALSEKKPPADDADELRKRRKDAAAETDKLAEAQDELQKKARDAAKIADPKQREEELRKLAREQEQLRRKAEDLAQRLTRDREDKAAEDVRKAADRMAAAQEQLEQGKPPAAKQDEALDKLDEALDKLDAERKQDQEQLTREKREELAEQLKAIRDRQAAAVAEAGRIQDAVTAAKEWTRGQLRSYADLEPGQKSLAGDLRGVADKQLADAPVFARLATQAADAMDRAARKAAERVQDTIPGDPFDPVAETAADDRVRGPMRTALRRLDQILGSLKDDPKPGTAKKPEAGEPAGGENAGEEPGAGKSGVPPLAQLKALRAVQAEVNERTAAFAKAHPDPDKYTDDEREELKELETTQREIAELFDKISSALDPGAELP